MDPLKSNVFDSGFEFTETRREAGPSATDKRLYLSAYDDLFQGLRLESNDPQAGDRAQRQRTRTEGSSERGERATDAAAVAHDVGDLQGAVPSAYLKYLNRYKQQGKPAPITTTEQTTTPPVVTENTQTTKPTRPEIKINPRFNSDLLIGPWQTQDPGIQKQNCTPYG